MSGPQLTSAYPIVKISPSFVHQVVVSFVKTARSAFANAFRAVGNKSTPSQTTKKPDPFAESSPKGIPKGLTKVAKPGSLAGGLNSAAVSPDKTIPSRVPVIPVRELQELVAMGHETNRRVCASAIKKMDGINENCRYIAGRIAQLGRCVRDADMGGSDSRGNRAVGVAIACVGVDLDTDLRHSIEEGKSLLPSLERAIERLSTLDSQVDTKAAIELFRGSEGFRSEAFHETGLGRYIASLTRSRDELSPTHGRTGGGQHGSAGVTVIRSDKGGVSARNPGLQTVDRERLETLVKDEILIPAMTIAAPISVHQRSGADHRMREIMTGLINKATATVALGQRMGLVVGITKSIQCLGGSERIARAGHDFLGGLRSSIGRGDSLLPAIDKAIVDFTDLSQRSDVQDALQLLGSFTGTGERDAYKSYLPSMTQHLNALREELQSMAPLTYDDLPPAYQAVISTSGRA